MNFVISNSCGKPIYEQIASQIKSMIIKNELHEGDALPSMRLLAKDLRISVITTKRAYEDLEQEGFIETVPSKGSFVAKKNIKRLKDQQAKSCEEFLKKAIDIAKESDISKEDLKEKIELLY